MDRLFQTTGWSCGWGSAAGALVGSVLDFLLGTSGLIALLLACAGSLLGGYVGFRNGSKAVEQCFPRPNSPQEDVKIHKQHGAMWSLMGAMVGGMVGSTAGAGVAAVGWIMILHLVPTMMDYMTMVNIMMGGGMGGMVGGVIGAWWGAMQAGFVGKKEEEPMG